MKRIKAACLLQTIHFQLKDDLGHAAAVKAAKDELEHYKVQLERNNTKFQIVDEVEQSDGSIIVHIKKQYNNHSCDEYMD
jgi:non-specific serine/threonine protein kinase